MICDLQHTAALFVSYSNSLEMFQGTVVNLDQDIMSDGGALSFSQAKALILKQRLSADEVKSLQTAPQTIFTEFETEVLHFFLLGIFLVSGREEDHSLLFHSVRWGNKEAFDVVLKRSDVNW